MRNSDWRSFCLPLLLVFAAFAAAPLSFAQSPSLEQLAAQLEARRAQGVDVLAPRNFQAALQAYEAARKDVERGRNVARIGERLAEAEAGLTRADQAAESARRLLAGVIKAREDALAAEAPKFVPDLWARAADRFRAAMIENEGGNLKNAQRRAAEAEVLLRDAELNAIKGSVLGEARATIARADAAKVGRLAPRTLEAAKRYLAEADQEIQRNRYDLMLARNLAAQATYEARHALYLAELIARTQAQRGDEAGLEALILSWEEPLKRIASSVNLEARFDEGLQPAIKELGEHVQRQEQELGRLRQELRDREEEIAGLTKELERLEARLGGVSQERLALQRRVDAQERLRANVLAIERLFTPDEARVYRQGDDVVISLLGIKFPSGRSTIDANSSALMLKVRDALALFPDASLTVEGHTDALGSDSANLILSQDRADAVKQYLVTNFGVDPEKVTSIGYGEARPVATNETAEGRARNRRIDLIIHITPR
jgi:OOP family OmpA-OmpF porin